MRCNGSMLQVCYTMVSLIETNFSVDALLLDFLKGRVSLQLNGLFNSDCEH